MQRYFGFVRGTGADHFDPGWRKPFVKEGIFRWSSDAMYAYGFLLLWAVAFWFASAGAAVVAAFSHAYIWVHYACTERPDIEVIYGREAS